MSEPAVTTSMVPAAQPEARPAVGGVSPWAWATAVAVAGLIVIWLIGR